MSTLLNKLEKYAQHHLNVMLIGSHGIGKSTITKIIAEKMNMKFKYYSASTLDPFADIVGIPAPDTKNQVLNYYRPKDLEEAEFLMFDELNRAHPRVLNAVLEIIQFKSVNGNPLPNLKMVWAAINPPGDDYQVEELDPALIDRFHQYIKMNAEINLEYLSSKMKPEIAKMLKDWWENTLNSEMRRVITPRRIEYLGMMISNDIPWRDAIPQGHVLIPVEDLARKIRIVSGEEDDFIINKENILSRKETLQKRMKSDPKTSIAVAEVMKKFTESEIFECRDLLENMPKELVNKVGKDKFFVRRRNIIQMFSTNSIDIEKYPKMKEAFSCDQ